MKRARLCDPKRRHTRQQHGAFAWEQDAGVDHPFWFLTLGCVASGGPGGRRGEWVAYPWPQTASSVQLGPFRTLEEGMAALERYWIRFYLRAAGEEALNHLRESVYRACGDIQESLMAARLDIDDGIDDGVPVLKRTAQMHEAAVEINALPEQVPREPVPQPLRSPGTVQGEDSGSPGRKGKGGEPERKGGRFPGRPR